MFRSVLIADRGAMAVRVARTLRRMGIAVVVACEPAGRQSLHAREADHLLALPETTGGALLDAARKAGVEAVHPGCSPFGTDAAFAAACESSGIAFVGARPEQIATLGNRLRARELAQAHHVPLLPASELLPDAAAARAAAARIGYPVALRDCAVHGPRGLHIVRSPAEMADAWNALAGTAPPAQGAFLERYVHHSRRIDVDVLGDGRGRCVALADRDVSAQRDHRTLLDEAPAPQLDAATRRSILEASARLCEGLRLRGAATVGFLQDAAGGRCWFLGVTPRLTAAHGVTEEATGVDIVEAMLRIAAGESRVIERLRPRANGSAMQARLLAEQAGIVTDLRLPTTTRMDTWIERGTELTASADRMLAAIVVQGETRNRALARLAAALQGARVGGLQTNLDFLRAVVANPAFVAGVHGTRLLEEVRWRAPVVHVLESGVQTTLQDSPGRIGYREAGVPSAGPMDEYAFRVANELVGNHRGRDAIGTALECTMTGPRLRFDTDAVIAVTGAPVEVTLDDQPLEMWISHAVSAGSTLRVGRIAGPGCRAYLAVAGGFSAPAYLGSRATYMLGRFGGHAGRSLRAGDVLHLAANPLSATLLSGASTPSYPSQWSLGVLAGPHAAPDFLAPGDLDLMCSSTWTVHFNSSRAGLRLVGPRLAWSRSDGGEAGLHPSSVLDAAYAPGAVVFTGDSPVILGPDGPTLGGGACPLVVARAELWKLGQIRPGDMVRFVLLGTEGAARLARDYERAIELLEPPPDVTAYVDAQPPRVTAILNGRLGDPVSTGANRVSVTWRQAGDGCVVVEYGAAVLDLGLRVRVHLLVEALRSAGLPGILDVAPGLRSLQVRFDPARLSRMRLLRVLEQIEDGLRLPADGTVPGRLVHLPLCWDDPAVAQAIERYSQSVRREAPWLPDNREFLRRVNGLEDLDALRDRVFSGTWLVLALGESGPGAPVAAALDPRHDLIAPRHDPPRTWTPEGAVGFAGAALRIHGMEGPGATQLVGRTLQVWNRYRATPDFEPNRPWLLRPFDQIRFHPVGAEELAALREDFPLGRCALRTEPASFDLRRHREALDRDAAAISAWRQRQHAAFEAERARWRQAEGTPEAAVERELSTRGLKELPAHARSVVSGSAGRVWRILRRPGEIVAEGEAVVVVECMAAQLEVRAPCRGRLLGLLCREGTPVSAGQDLVVIEPL